MPVAGAGPAYRVIADLTDHTTGDVIRAGRLLPRHLADDPAVVARLAAARCLGPAEVAGDTPALPAVEVVDPAGDAGPETPAPAAVRRPVRGRRRTKG